MHNLLDSIYRHVKTFQSDDSRFLRLELDRLKKVTVRECFLATVFLASCFS